MDTTHYIPQADEPSPFVIDTSFPPTIEWNIWRKAQATGFFDFLAAETARVRLIALLEHEAPRSPENLAKLPRGSKAVKDVSLTDLIRAKYELNAPWMTAYRFVMRENHNPSSEDTVMEQKDVLKCDFTEMVEYLTDPDNVWNPEKYIPSRTLNGNSFGKESMIRMQYVRGAGFAEGYVGNYKFILYYSNIQGWQLHWLGTLDGGMFSPPLVRSLSPDAVSDLLTAVKERAEYVPLSLQSRTEE